MSTNAPNEEGLWGLQVLFRDKNFFFIFSPNQKYWGFQKELVLALCEFRSDPLRFNKGISNELEKIYSFLPYKVVIYFSDEIPTSDTRLPLVAGASALPSATTYLQGVKATLYLAEFWNEIRRSSRNINPVPSVTDYLTRHTEEEERALLGLTDESEEIIPLRLGMLKMTTMKAPIAYTFLRALAMILECCRKAE